MLINKTRISCEEEYFPLLAADPEASVFFDIETTGFSPDSSCVYLIGAAFRGFEGWQLTQWMILSPEEEPSLLEAFSSFLEGCRFLIHFNGDRFDLPYLDAKYHRYSLPSPLSFPKSIDLFRSVKPVKKLLSLDHLNQKSLERFLSLFRKDTYSGGELISLYHEYCRTRDRSLEEILLLHNREDVAGMTQLLRLCPYFDLSRTFFSSDEPLACPPRISAVWTDAHGATVKNAQQGGCLMITACFTLPFPVSLERACGQLTLNLFSKYAVLKVPVFFGELKFFFDHWKDYYYLPAEDQAIHKSVAVFVDPSCREKATRKTCYTRKSGCFLPQPDALFTPAFRETYSDKQTYFLPDEAFLLSEDTLRQYLSMWLKCF